MLSANANWTSGKFYCSGTINPLPEDNILDWSKLKAFADDKINVTQKLKVALRKVENMVGKGYFLRVVKSRNCVVKS